MSKKTICYATLLSVVLFAAAGIAQSPHPAPTDGNDLIQFNSVCSYMLSGVTGKVACLALSLIWVVFAIAIKMRWYKTLLGLMAVGLIYAALTFLDALGGVNNTDCDSYCIGSNCTVS